VDFGLNRKTFAGVTSGCCGMTVVLIVLENSKSTMVCAPEHCHDGAFIALIFMILAFSSLSIIASALKLPNKTPY
jgi:hypothetical protein